MCVWVCVWWSLHSCMHACCPHDLPGQCTRLDAHMRQGFIWVCIRNKAHTFQEQGSHFPGTRLTLSGNKAHTFWEQGSHFPGTKHTLSRNKAHTFQEQSTHFPGTKHTLSRSKAHTFQEQGSHFPGTGSHFPIGVARNVLVCFLLISQRPNIVFIHPCPMGFSKSLQHIIIMYSSRYFPISPLSCASCMFPCLSHISPTHSTITLIAC